MERYFVALIYVEKILPPAAVLYGSYFLPSYYALNHTIKLMAEVGLEFYNINKWPNIFEPGEGSKYMVYKTFANLHYFSGMK